MGLADREEAALSGSRSDYDAWVEDEVPSHVEAILALLGVRHSA